MRLAQIRELLGVDRFESLALSSLLHSTRGGFQPASDLAEANHRIRREARARMDAIDRASARRLVCAVCGREMLLPARIEDSRCLCGRRGPFRLQVVQ